MKDKIFRERYGFLTKKQKEAVDTIDGPVMVIAGPGTGKTTILTLRIAQILKKTDTPADAILALTFTEAGARAMREKLHEIIGNEAFKVSIFTFHGFANYLITKYPEEFPEIVRGKQADEAELVSLSEEIIDGSDFEFLMPYGDKYMYIPKALGAIKDLKRENISPEKLKKFIKEELKIFKDFQKNNREIRKTYLQKQQTKENMLKRTLELSVFYEQYENKLRSKKLYDFEDSIVSVVKTLDKSVSFKREVQENYHYILADEHQDANGSQNRMLELISDFFDSPNLFVVGDEKQAIFRFQGATIDHFRFFSNKYKNAKKIILEDNFRSHQYILDASSEIIKSTINESQNLKSINNNLKPISILEFYRKDSELLFVAKEVEKIRKQGEMVAILSRKNDDADEMSQVLSKLNISHSRLGSKDFFKTRFSKVVMSLFKSVMNPQDDEAISEVLLQGVSGVSILDAIKVIKNSKEENITVFNFLRGLKSGGYENSDNLKKLSKNILFWATSARKLPPNLFLEKIFTESGIYEKFSLDTENLAYMRALFREGNKVLLKKENAVFSDFFEHIKALNSYNISIEGEDRFGEESVFVSTIHGSKGLEFDHVFIIEATNEKWLKQQNRKYFLMPFQKNNQDESDERRLFYVAMTRAKKHLSIAYPQRDSLRNYSKLIFLNEIFDSLKEEKVIEETLNSVGISKSIKKLSVYESILKECFFVNSFSVTALNNYIKCPWEYFFKNLVRVPFAPNKFSSYGTAFHKTINFYFRSKSEVSKNDFIKEFQRQINKQPVTKKEKLELIKKGNKSISLFFQNYLKNVPVSGQSEKEISTKIFIGKKSIFFKGIIDYVYQKQDGSFHVVDFKTSKPKSRNEIIGNTAEKDASFFRQLVCYKYLSDLNNKEKVSSGEICFTEEEKGKTKNETFDISQDDVLDLKNEIEKTLKGIIEGSFIDSYCEKKDCEFCLLGRNVKESLKENL